jgi:hypothetical protein
LLILSLDHLAVNAALLLSFGFSSKQLCVGDSHFNIGVASVYPIGSG